MSDKCVHCGEELIIWEKTRSECWNCRDLTTETYEEGKMPAEFEEL